MFISLHKGSWSSFLLALQADAVPYLVITDSLSRPPDDVLEIEFVVAPFTSYRLARAALGWVTQDARRSLLAALPEGEVRPLRGETPDAVAKLLPLISRLSVFDGLPEELVRTDCI